MPKSPYRHLQARADAPLSFPSSLELEAVPLVVLGNRQKNAKKRTREDIRRQQQALARIKRVAALRRLLPTEARAHSVLVIIDSTIKLLAPLHDETAGAVWQQLTAQDSADRDLLRQYSQAEIEAAEAHIRHLFDCMVNEIISDADEGNFERLRQQFPVYAL